MFLVVATIVARFRLFVSQNTIKSTTLACARVHTLNNSQIGNNSLRHDRTTVCTYAHGQSCDVYVYVTGLCIR